MEITRRSFARASVAGAGALAATACLASAGAAVADEAAATAAPAYDATVPQTWDRECEVLVLGLGIAGCCALVEAYDLGADVLAVNSAASVIDCSCTRSGGWICGVGSRIQKAEGIEDSVDLFVDDIRRDGGDAGDPDIIRAWGEISGETIDWLQDLGCDVVQRTLDARTEAGSDAHSVARDYITNPVGGGLGWMTGLGDAIDERGIEVLWSTKATQLYRNAEGRVVGAHVEAMDGSSAEDIAASKGVILAVGGLGRDLNAHKSYTPSMREVVNEAAEVNFGCSENCLGNGYQMARDIDAYVFNSPPTQGSNTRINNHGEVYGAGWLEYIWGHDAGIIEVNLNGERFNDECSFEDYYNKKMWSKQPRMESVIIFDSETLATPDGQTYAQPLIDTVQAGGADTVKSADTIEELAEAFGIPAETLVKTVEEFNAHVDSQEPDEFGRTSFAMKVATPPFWGGRTDVVVGISKGGCKIDPQARVIDTKDRVIPGLYAAGEIAFAQAHGDARTHIVGGPNGSAACFGRIAARSAVADGE